MTYRQRYTPAERALLREARQFMRARAHQLEAMLGPSRELRGRLAATAAYRRVAGTDAAEREPTWDLAGTLEVCFEHDVTSMVRYLHKAAARARLRRTARGGRRDG